MGNPRFGAATRARCEENLPVGTAVTALWDGNSVNFREISSRTLSDGGISPVGHM